MPRRGASTPTPGTRAACLAALRDLEEATVTELAGRTGLSRPTVDLALADLEADGLVIPVAEPAHSTRAGGRPARVSRFAAGQGAVGGIDLSGPRVEVAICDLAGRTLSIGRVRPPCPSNDSPDLAVVTVALEAALADAGLGRDRLRAVGVGVAGLVDTGGVVLNAAIRAWNADDLQGRLEVELGVPVVIDNDLALAATAESRFGALAGAHTGVYALTWHHVSARITVGGEVLRGRNSSAGEVGLLQSFAALDQPKGPITAAIPAVADEIQRLRTDPDDRTGKAALSWLISNMTPAVTALVLAVDPDVVVLGGALGDYADLVAPELTRRVNGFGADRAGLDVLITGNDLGRMAICIGAQQRAFEKFSDEIYATPGVAPPGLNHDRRRPSESRRHHLAGRTHA